MRYFAANWKMNLAPDEARAFLDSFLPACAPRADRRLLFFPPAVSLPAVYACLANRGDAWAGIQNIYWEDKGAFTGEISAPMARAAGATYALVGHSERRHVFHETDAETGKKCAAAVRAGLTPMLCVGETLAERDAGQTEAVVGRQLRAGFAAVTPAAVAGSLVAYEPVWAIGTGRTATPADASAVHAALRAALRQLQASSSTVPGPDVPILYGGSVNRTNVAALLAAPGVDGVLVGGASLDAATWGAIVNT
jgi:triosephosphate isomerase